MNHGPACLVLKSLRACTIAVASRFPFSQELVSLPRAYSGTLTQKAKFSTTDMLLWSKRVLPSTTTKLL